MEKCFSANMSRHRYLYKNQLRESRDLKGGFVLGAEETQKILAAQSITYSEISGEKRFHPERLRPQMEAQATAWKKEVRKAAEAPETQEGKEAQEAKKTGKTPLPPVICDYFHDKGTNKIDFSYSQPFVEIVGNCTQGYRTVDVSALLSLRSRYARLFFIYLSGSAKDFRFGEDKVREMFGLEEHYKRFSSLKKRLECVRDELEELGITFQWEFRREGRENALLVQAKGMERYHPSVQKEKSLSPKAKDLSGELVDFLKQKVKMTDKGIAANKNTFLEYIKFFGEKELIAFLCKKMDAPGYWEKHSRIGWLIGAVKGETADEQATGRVEEKKADISGTYEYKHSWIKEMAEKTQRKLTKHNDTS
jgi:hypothetical protein